MATTNFLQAKRCKREDESCTCGGGLVAELVSCFHSLHLLKPENASENCQGGTECAGMSSSA